MEEIIILILKESGTFAYVISILLNIVFSLFFLPSIVITMGNIALFGPVIGTLLSYISEVIGAVITYYAYKFGLGKLNIQFKNIDMWKGRLYGSSTTQTFLILLLLRLIPFVPSSGVTALAVLTEVSFGVYVVATIIGKVPSLLMEGLLAYGINSIFGIDFNAIIILICIIGICMLIYRFVKNTLIKTKGMKN